MTTQRNSRNRFRALFNYSDDVIFICDVKGHILEANEQAVITFGSDVVGKSTKTLNDTLLEAITYVKSTQLVQSAYRTLKVDSNESPPFHCTIIPVYNKEIIDEIIIRARNVEDISLLRDEIQSLKDKITALEKEKESFLKGKDSSKASITLADALKKLEIANEKLETINKNFTKELELASILQKSLIPAKVSKHARLHFALHFEPMGLVGGDYCDIIDLGADKKGVILADVSGHGVSSAFIAAMLKISFLNYGLQTDSPAGLLQKLNDEYCSVIKTGDYVTAFYSIFDVSNQKIIYSGAGHPMPLLYHKKSGKLELLPSHGFFVGMFEEAEYRDSVATFNPGDRYLAYTDGIIEAYSEEKEEQFGAKRLKESFKNHKNMPMEKMLDAIVDDVKIFMNKSKFYDDLTMIALEYS